MTHRTAARVVGLLFVTATVPFSISVLVLAPIIGASDFLAGASNSSTRVGGGVLLELVNHISVVGIAVVMYPVLKQFSERLALGYVVARSIEAVLFAIGTMHLIALLNLSHDFVIAGEPIASHFQTLGGMLVNGHDWDRSPLAFTAFGISALILNFALFQTRLVPRWIAALGLLAGLSILSARVMLLAGFPLPSSTVMALDTPIMVQEMIFAVWLLAKGFDEAAFQIAAECQRATKNAQKWAPKIAHNGGGDEPRLGRRFLLRSGSSSSG